MVCEEGVNPTFQEETEVSHSGVSSWEFTVEGGVMGLCGGQLLGEEVEGSPGATNHV